MTITEKLTIINAAEARNQDRLRLFCEAKEAAKSFDHILTTHPRR